eukprot:CAMPEP_0178808472 /NCGR_PEP_ID=MMETSP0745-20121128/17549_1 /TAXON_ID=913974 /ORGANISM="Nitzschia punctata, Strain CCMP561" /LENGTH=46 /DNA_ID= /DNA_START= /DNA_END= /DNA_ORIENTATION=
MKPRQATLETSVPNEGNTQCKSERDGGERIHNTISNRSPEERGIQK